MRDVVLASTVGFKNTSSNQLDFIVDPSRSHEIDMKGLILLAYMPSVREVSNLIQSGETTPEQLTRASQKLTDICVQFYDVFVKTIVSK